MEILLVITIVLLLVLIGLVIWLRPRQLPDNTRRLEELNAALGKLEAGLREDARLDRQETLANDRAGRQELLSGLQVFRQEMKGILDSVVAGNRQTMDLVNRTLSEGISALLVKLEQHNQGNREAVSGSLKDFSQDLRNLFDQLRAQQAERFGVMEEKQERLVNNTEKKLEQMRETVEEKLQQTLQERLSLSFETVGKQLQAVQEGLGEMRSLAQDVGGLKRVLSNVKMRGGVGEVQLEMLLEQLLAPDQYQANVKTKSGSSDLVEFAIKLPGKDDQQGVVWLPIDAKFPKEYYEHLQTAYDAADPVAIELAQKELENSIKRMARDISEKYLDPPHTTDFAIMFLPFEGIYAEVVRKAALLEELQRTYKVLVTGPTTLGAILNSLQMGFRTLAIQKRSGEVWQVLGAVKREFESFGSLLAKAQNNIQTGLNQIDDVIGKRTRAIQRKLKGVEALGDPETRLILGNEEEPGGSEEPE